MNLRRINHRAEIELRNSTAVDKEVERVRQLGAKYPNGTDFRINEVLIKAVEKRCDDEGIPFYPVAINVASTALDYSKLASYERQR